MNNKVKYPRTKHLMWSKSISSDDKKLKSVKHFYGKEIVMTEKRDGENSNLMRDCIYARSLDSNDHPSRHWLKGMWANMKFNIPDNWRICGENLYAKHSVGYDSLETYFEVFSIWNEENVCLSIDDTLDWCELLGLIHVPILYRGKFDEDFLKNYKIDTKKVEGYVIRLADSFKYEDFNFSVAKWVRENHVQTNDHWMYNKIIKNKLKKY